MRVKELGRYGAIPLGGAVLTSAGRLPFRGIVHVAGINMLWRSSEFSVRQSVRNAMKIAQREKFRSIAFPLVGAGSGGGSSKEVLRLMLDELNAEIFDGEVLVVRYYSGS